MITVYGIPNCDTVKKARAWLQAEAMTFTFHDFKKQGVPADKLPVWASSVGWDKLINRNGTTWRRLGQAEQAKASTNDGKLTLVLAHPGLVKRPVVEWGAGALDAITVGFIAADWAKNAANR